MFGFLKDKTVDIVVLMNDIKELEADNKALKKAIDSYAHAAMAAQVSIDWNIIEAFSIERTVMYNSGLAYPRSTIGMILNGEIKEWHIYCNEDVHKTIVESFNEHKKVKYNAD